MKKIDIAAGINYLEVPEEDLRILCGCPENSIKFIMQKGLTPKLENSNFVGGPNAILLNDISIQNSHYLNFAEFPVLHHQFFQGAAFNGKNEKFTLIGIESRVKNQQEYIRCGFQGLITKDELMKAHLDDATANKFLAMGSFYRNGHDEFDIIEPVFITGKTNVKGDLYVERKSLNIFEFTYNDEKVTVDLNLPSDAKGVGLPYNIDQQRIISNDFTVTTIGDGNGWNPHVPCMSSVISIKGKKYLIDSGPGSLDLLSQLSITPSELDGIFLTHSHDDHFAGILSLLNAEHKLKFFATSLVKTSIQTKFKSLLNVKLNDLKRFVDFIELTEGKWIDIGDMEVKSNYSFHTVETNIYYFRAKDRNGNYKTYGHITDISSRKDLDIMIKKDKTGFIKKDWAYDWFSKYLEKCDLKRIDAGGGSVHGDSNDFIEDQSTKIILSHLDKDIDISASPHFAHPTEYGHTEVLIHSNKNYLIDIGNSLITDIGFNKFMDKVSKSDIMLKKPGEIVYTRGETLSEMYLVLSGMVEGYDPSTDYVRKYVKGDFIYSFNREKVSQKDYVASNHCYLLKLDIKAFYKFVKTEKHSKAFNFLHNSSFFSYGMSYESLLKLSSIMTGRKVKKGEILELEDNSFYFVEEGLIKIEYKDKPLTNISKDGLSVCSMNTETCPRSQFISQIASKKSYIYEFKKDDTQPFVAFMWSIFEEYRKAETIVEIGRI